MKTDIDTGKKTDLGVNGSDELLHSLSEQEQQVRDIQKWRNDESRRLIESGHTLEEIISYFDNDYSPLERLYKEKVGVNLIADPIESANHEIPITKSCSIVIPAYNSGEQLRHSLLAIQASSFNSKFPTQLEVIIVDDESPTVSISELVQNLNLSDLNVKVLRQSNGREGKGRYSGALAAKGDVILFTDQDVVYSPTLIEEYMKRHEILGDISCFGFRYDIETDDNRLKADAIASGSLGEFDLAFDKDQRIAEDAMRDCNWLKGSGNGNPIPIPTNGDWSWDLPGMAWGFSVSAPREVVIRIAAAADERYRGWGGEDHNLAAELIAEGLYLIPNTGGIALHQQHATRHNPDGADQNRRVLKSNLQSSPRRQDIKHPRPTDAQLELEVKNNRTEAIDPVGMPEDDVFNRARMLLKMCRYEEAIILFNQVEDQHKEDPWYLYDKAVTLTALGGADHVEQAIKLTKKAIDIDSANPWLRIALAEAYGRSGYYKDSLREYEAARRLDPNNIELQFLDGDRQKKSRDIHDNAAKNYLRRGKPRASLRHYDRAIALAGGPADAAWSAYDKGVALFQLKQIPEALQELHSAAQFLTEKTWALLILGEVYESIGEKGHALSYYNQAYSADQNNSQAQEAIGRLTNQ